MSDEPMSRSRIRRLSAQMQAADESDLQAAHREIEQLRAELAAANTRAKAAEAALAAVPVEELRRWFEHSSVGHDVDANRYDRDEAWQDMDSIRYWLDGNADDGVPPATSFRRISGDHTKLIEQEPQP